jgi:hypothetical protein
MIETFQIFDDIVTFEKTNHIYTVNGKKVVSVTQLIDSVLPKKYKKVDPEILQKAADRGTNLHDMIEQFERFETTYDDYEFKQYISLKKQHQWEVLESEKIVILKESGIPIAAGRFDMIVKSPYINGLGIADVKRTAHIHTDHIKLQLNLYKRAYEQTYRKKIHYLKCIHIRNCLKEYIDIPIDLAYTQEKINDYLYKNPLTFE